MRYLVIFCALFFTTSLEAQDGKQKMKTEFGAGLKAGLNFQQTSNQGFEEEFNTNPLAGIYTQVFVNKVGLSVEALWSTNNYTTDSSFNGLFSQYLNQGVDSAIGRSFTFHNISVPVLLNYKLLNRLWLQAGPQFTTVATVVDKDNVVQSGQEIFYTGDISLVAGVQLKLIKNISVGSRYLFAISNNNNWDTSTQWDNRQLQAYLCIGL